MMIAAAGGGKRSPVECSDCRWRQAVEARKQTPLENNKANQCKKLAMPTKRRTSVHDVGVAHWHSESATAATLRGSTATPRAPR
jgi:hypothetical protein